MEYSDPEQPYHMAQSQYRNQQSARAGLRSDTKLPDAQTKYTMHCSCKILTSFSICSLAICSFLLTSCRGDEVVYPTIGTQVTEEVRQGGLYVLCEGNMGTNKARLDYVNLESGTYYSNWYGA